MTRINTTPAPIHKPDTMSFGELAIAAGMAGNPVAVSFSESDAAVDGELWNYFAQLADSGRVLHVQSQSEVTKLKKNFDHWRLVVVHALRLLNPVAWTVQSHVSATRARPAVFSRILPDTVDDLPLPLLVLRSTADESTSIVRWLMSGCPERAVLPTESPVNRVAFDPLLVPVTLPSQLPNGRGPMKLRDCQLLKALLSGACLIGSAGESASPTCTPTCGQPEYERVRRLLQSPLLCTADEPVDQLAVDMVNRANVFLELKGNPELFEGNPLRCEGTDPTWSIRGTLTRQELITRSQLTDLGNIQSGLIREIIEFLQSMRPRGHFMSRVQNGQTGYAMFQQMGLVRRPPSEQNFKSGEPQVLARMLRSWTAKQVRSSFEKLHKSGLISGVREHGNGPWQYQLPEELSDNSSPFRSMPAANDLFAAVGAST